MAPLGSHHQDKTTGALHGHHAPAPQPCLPSVHTVGCQAWLSAGTREPVCGREWIQAWPPHGGTWQRWLCHQGGPVPGGFMPGCSCFCGGLGVYWEGTGLGMGSSMPVGGTECTLDPSLHLVWIEFCCSIHVNPSLQPITLVSRRLSQGWDLSRIHINILSNYLSAFCCAASHCTRADNRPLAAGGCS